MSKIITAFSTPAIASLLLNVESIHEKRGIINVRTEKLKIDLNYDLVIYLIVTIITVEDTIVFLTI
jgi:hypothetical protein